MKLVNIYKHVLILIILLGWNTLRAQDVWTLQQCTDSAKVYNKSLQINRNNVTSGEEREKEAKANLNPKISAVADYKYFVELPHQLMPMNIFNPTVPEGQYKDVQFGVPHTINASAQLAMPLFNPQIKGAIENAKTASELTRLQYRKTEEQVSYDVATLYYNAQLLIHQLEFIDSNLVNTNKLVKNMQLLHEQLLAKGSDVNKVKLQADQLSTQRENVNNKLVQVLNALKLAMGIGLERNIMVEKDIHFQTAIQYDTKTITDLDLLSTQHKLLNNELKVLSKSSYLPSISLIASYGTSGFGYDKKPNSFLKFYPVGFAGVQLTYPIFNGGITKRKINQKNIEIRNNELQSQLIADKNKMEIENVSRERLVAEKTLTNTESQIIQAQTIYNQTVLQQREGTANLTEVLMADNALREAQQNYLSAAIDYLKADLELKKITGNLGD
jgi:OMF family outer membrane factor